MFTAIAKSRVIDRGRVTPATIVPAFSNDNRPDRQIRSDMRDRRRSSCRWAVNPVTGRLECHWEFEGAIDDEPQSGRRSPWPVRQAMRLTG